MSATFLEGINACYPPNKISCISNLSLSIPKGKVTCLVGESGSGKTTVLRLLAGFMRPCRGSICIDGTTVASERVWTEPEDRNVGVLFQDYALFPHLTVEDNILFGAPVRGGLGGGASSGGPGGAREEDKHKNNALSARGGKHNARALREDILNELLGLCDLQAQAIRKRYPHQLSGGQMQRIALARSLAARPRILILDEPFSNIGLEMRDRMLAHVKRIIAAYGMTVLYITHEKDEAFSVADTLAIIQNGSLQQQGAPRDLYERPVNAYVARYFDAANIIPLSVQRESDDEFLTPVGLLARSRIAGLEDAARGAAMEAHICVRPHELHFVPEGTASGAPLRVAELRYYGSHYDAHCASEDTRFAGNRLIVRITANPPREGSTVRVAIKDELRQLHAIRG